MRELIRRYGTALAMLFGGTCVIWLLGLILLPGLFLTDLSFRHNLPPDQIGGPADSYTFDNYLTLIHNTVHYAIFAKTIWGSTLVTIVALLVCYPVAYYLGQVARPRTTSLLMLLLVVPFWVNEILRSFAWYIILSYRGPLNTVLLTLGLINAPIRYFSSAGSVIVGMVYAYVLYMIFPLYNAIQTLDPNQIEAARDLGAPAWRIHWRVVIPHAKPGIATGCIMVFMLAASSYAVPAILGGPGNRWFTEVIYDWFFNGQNWNQGAAYAYILLLLCLVFILAMMGVFRVRLADIAK